MRNASASPGPRTAPCRMKGTVISRPGHAAVCLSPERSQGREIYCRIARGWTRQPAPDVRPRECRTGLVWGVVTGYEEPESRFLSRAPGLSQGRFCAALLRNDSSGVGWPTEEHCPQNRGAGSLVRIRPHAGRKKVLRSRAKDCVTEGYAWRSLRMTGLWEAATPARPRGRGGAGSWATARGAGPPPRGASRGSTPGPRGRRSFPARSPPARR